MINANELRVGNFVHRNDLDGLYSIRSVCIDRIHPINLTEHDFKKNVHYGCECTLSELEPIKLEEDMLLRCGFVKDNNGYDLPGTYFSLTDMFYPCWMDRMLWPQDVEKFKSMSLQYLDQLQNLYFALTGEELIYKP